MKKLIVGATLFISGVIGIAAIIISCAVKAAALNGIRMGLMELIFSDSYCPDCPSFALPFSLSILLLALGVNFIIRGYRGKN